MHLNKLQLVYRLPSATLSIGSRLINLTNSTINNQYRPPFQQRHLHLAGGPFHQARIPAACHITARQDGPVLTLSLNNPKTRNSLSLEVLQELRTEFERASKKNSTVEVVILRAEGPVFSAGHNLKELLAKTGTESHAALFAECSKVMDTITEARYPVIAAVSGLATAAGCQLVATCDLAVAGQSAKFATPGVMVGLFCTTPGVALGRAVPRKVAMEMLLTAEPIDAKRALENGLVNKVVPDGEVDDAAKELADKIAHFSPLVIALGKAAFNKQMKLDQKEAYSYAERVMVDNLKLPDGQEGVNAFIEKRRPVWKSIGSNSEKGS